MLHRKTIFLCKIFYRLNWLKNYFLGLYRNFKFFFLHLQCLTWAVVSSFKASEKIHHRVEPPPTVCNTEGEQLDKHKGSYDCGNDSSYQSKPLLDYNEKQCYSKDVERTIVVESEMHEVFKAETSNTSENWSLNRSNSDRSDKLLSCIILTSQTLLVITGVQTLKMMLHFFLKYRILFCHKDLVSMWLFCQKLRKWGKLEFYLRLTKLPS